MRLSVPFRPLWFAGYMDISAELFVRKITSRRSGSDKPRLPGVADTRVQPRQAKVAGGLQIQISPLSPVVHFRMELGRMKPCFIPTPPCSPFHVPKNYSLCRNLVVVAVTRKETKGLTLLRSCLRQESEYGRMK